MLKKIFVLSLTLFLSLRLALPDDGIQMWIQVLRQARSPDVDIYDKKQALFLAQEDFKIRLKKKYGYDDTKIKTLLLDKTPEAIEFRNKLLSCDNPVDPKTCEMRDFYTEINYLIAGLISDGIFNKCDYGYSASTIKEHPLAQSILKNQSTFCASQENMSSCRHYRINNKFTLKNGKTGITTWPSIYVGESAATLFNVTDPVLNQAYRDDASEFFGKPFPRYKGSGLKEEDYIEYKMKEEMKEALYTRSMSSAIETKVSFQVLFGNTPSTQIHTLIDREIAAQCKNCSIRMKSEIKNRAVAFVEKKVPKEKSAEFVDKRNAVLRLCRGLKNQGYFNPTKSGEIENLPLTAEEADRTVVLSGVTVVAKNKKSATATPLPEITNNSTHGRGSDFFSTFSTKNVQDATINKHYADQKAREKALSHLIQHGEEGLLFATDALTRKNDNGDPYTTPLRCSWNPNDMDHDVRLITEGIAEADAKIQTHIDEVNKAVIPMTGLNPKQLTAATSQIQDLIKKNPIAAGAVLADNPNSTGIICESVTRVVHDELQESELKSLKVVGLGVLSLATMGISSLPLAAIAGLSITGLTVTDQVIEKDKAEDRAESFRAALYATATGDAYLVSEIKKNEAEAAALSFEWYDVFGFALDSLDGITLLREGIKLFNNVKTVHAATILLKQKIGATNLKKLSLKEKLDELKKIKLDDATVLASKTEIEKGERIIGAKTSFKQIENDKFVIEVNPERVNKHVMSGTFVTKPIGNMKGDQAYAIAGGMHHPDGFQEFYQKNEKVFSSFDDKIKTGKITATSAYTDFREAFDQIEVIKGKNGVLIAKVPEEFYTTQGRRALELAVKRGEVFSQTLPNGKVLIGKTLFPEKWTKTQTEKAINWVRNNGSEKTVANGVKVRTGTVDGVTIEVKYGKNPDQAAFETAHPIYTPQNFSDPIVVTNQFKKTSRSTASTSPTRTKVKSFAPKEIADWTAKIKSDPVQKRVWYEFQTAMSKMKLTPLQKNDILHALYRAHARGKPGTYEKLRSLVELRHELQSFGFTRAEAKTAVRQMADVKILGVWEATWPKVDNIAKIDDYNAFRKAYEDNLFTGADSHISFSHADGHRYPARVEATSQNQVLVTFLKGTDEKGHLISEVKWLDWKEITTCRRSPSAQKSFDGVARPNFNNEDIYYKPASHEAWEQPEIFEPLDIDPEDAERISEDIESLVDRAVDFLDL